MPATTPLPAVALSLALAVVASSTGPLLLLDGDCVVIAASASFGLAFGLVANDIRGRSIYALGGGEWDVPRLRSLLGGTISGAAEVPAYEMDLALPGRGNRRLVLHAHRLVYAIDRDEAPAVRVLLAINDVTAARQSERMRADLLREKAELLEEIHHRVANSLQIIASVLMQSARNVGSDESRAHLHDAHTRVMAIAELERQLAESPAEAVDVGQYLDQLCASLGASMIEDHGRIRLSASADGSKVTANQSVSIGLIVTELVINALKHGFPDHRRGTIDVTYRGDAGGWRLVVADDGVGMPAAGAMVAGLGSNIVNALARHLHAGVTISDARPGTCVTIAQLAPGGPDDGAELAL